VITQFTDKLAVHPISENIHLPYLTKFCIRLAKGVYARNLALTRLIHGPLCYGESLCQNHFEECIRLNAKDLEINGIRGPVRVIQVAKAYYDALRSFILGKKENEDMKQQIPQK
jgi:hypothetical protein